MNWFLVEPDLGNVVIYTSNYSTTEKLSPVSKLAKLVAVWS